MAAKRGEGSSDHDGEVCVVVELPEVGRFDFEKIKFKNFENVTDAGVRAACEG
jgi:hypothetical protein